MNPQLLISLALLAAGTYTTYQANSSARDRMNKAALTGQKRQTDLNEEAQARTTDFAENVYKPETREENTKKSANEAISSLMQQVTSSRDRGMGETTKADGKITGAYQKGRAKTVGKTLKRASMLANLMGKARGPTDLRFKEALQTGKLGGEMSELESLMRSRAGTDANLTQVAGVPSPAALALGSLMSGVGTAGAMGSVTSTTGPTTQGMVPNTVTSGMTSPNGINAMRYPYNNGINAMFPNARIS
jgi:hypothetical protein